MRIILLLLSILSLTSCSGSNEYKWIDISTDVIQSEEIKKKLVDISLQQSKDEEDFRAEIHSAFTYESPRVDKNWKHYQMLGVDIEFFGYEWMDLDDIEIYDITNESKFLWGWYSIYLDEKWRKKQYYEENQKSLRVLAMADFEQVPKFIKVNYWWDLHENPISVTKWEYPYADNKISDKIKHKETSFQYGISDIFYIYGKTFINTFWEDYSIIVDMDSEEFITKRLNIEIYNIDSDWNLWAAVVYKTENQSNQYKKYTRYLQVYSSADLDEWSLISEYELKKWEPRTALVLDKQAFVYEDDQIFKLEKGQLVSVEGLPEAKWIKRHWEDDPSTIFTDYGHRTIALPWERKLFLWDWILYEFAGNNWKKIQELNTYNEYVETIVADSNRGFYYIEDGSIKYSDFERITEINTPANGQIQSISSWPEGDILFKMRDEKGNIWGVYNLRENKTILINIQDISNMLEDLDIKWFYYSEKKDDINIFSDFGILEIPFSEIYKF